MAVDLPVSESELRHIFRVAEGHVQNIKEMRAYLMMLEFLEDRYAHLPSDALGGLLGELSLQPDGRPADPAVGGDWERAVERIGMSSSGQGITPMRRAG